MFGSIEFKDDDEEPRLFLRSCRRPSLSFRSSLPLLPLDPLLPILPFLPLLFAFASDGAPAAFTLSPNDR